MENNFSQNIVENSRYERDSFTSVFMQFTEDSKYYRSYAFCFYEGEDGKYYDSRIRKVFSDNIYTYKLNGKKNVLKLYRRLSDDPEYKDSCCMYFIDRDFGFDSVQGEDIYQTPCYSIENLYVNEDSLKRILQSEFGLNPRDEVSIKIIDSFKMRLKEFIDIITEFNVYIYLRDKKQISNSVFKANDIKTSSITNIKLFFTKA